MKFEPEDVEPQLDDGIVIFGVAVFMSAILMLTYYLIFGA